MWAQAHSNKFEIVSDLIMEKIGVRQYSCSAKAEMYLYSRGQMGQS